MFKSDVILVLQNKILSHRRVKFKNAFGVALLHCLKVCFKQQKLSQSYTDATKFSPYSSLISEASDCLQNYIHLIELTPEITQRLDLEKNASEFSGLTCESVWQISILEYLTEDCSGNQKENETKGCV